MNKIDLAAFRTHSITNLIWWGIMSVGFCFCFKIGVDGYVKLHNDPPWLTLINLLATLAGAWVFPARLFRKMEARQKEFVSTFASRLAKIEESLDPGRTSTSLMEDGTDPVPGLSK